MVIQIATCPTAADCPGEEIPDFGIYAGDPLVVRCASWVEPGEAQVGPETVAADLLARIDEMLPEPRVVTSPPADRAAVIDVPTFLRVENWGAQTYNECDDVLGLVCITLTATPYRMRFESGEPEVGVMECDGPGVLYDPSGPEAEIQAQSDDACVHYYTRRTGIDDRPERWPGALAVDWHLTWTSNVDDEVRTPPDAHTVADVLREVNEVQAVVTD